MIRWLNGTIDSVNMSESEQTPGDSEGQGQSPGGHKESDRV